MSTVSKMAVKGVPLNSVAQAQTEAAEDKKYSGVRPHKAYTRKPHEHFIQLAGL